MESNNKYTINGISITSNPPRRRNNNNTLISNDFKSSSVSYGDTHVESSSSTHDPQISKASSQTFYQQCELNSASTSCNINSRDIEASTGTTPRENYDEYMSFSEINTEDVENFHDKSYTYEYFDHPADVIIMGEGVSINESFESTIIGLYNYISDLSSVEVAYKRELRVEAIGLFNLLYHLLDECLHLYNSSYFVGKHVEILDDIVLSLECKDFDDYKFTVSLIVYGDYFNPKVHTSGTEIKAITMHHLKIVLNINDLLLSLDNSWDSKSVVFNHLKDISDDTIKVSMCRSYVLVDI